MVVCVVVLGGGGFFGGGGGGRAMKTAITRSIVIFLRDLGQDDMGRNNVVDRTWSK